MKNPLFFTLAASTLLSGVAVADPGKLDVKVAGFADGGMIPETFAYCMPDGNGKSKSAPNLNPAISWSGAPEGTKSFAVIVVDTEVPLVFTDANQEGKTIKKDFPRQSFYHWVLYNIPVSVTSIAEGQASTGTPEGGKPLGKTDYGMNGQNDYAKVFKGNFGGYDGPCPPWNDERMHEYHFRVYALDVESISAPENVNGEQLPDIIAPHALAWGEVTGTYTQNPALLKK